MSNFTYGYIRVSSRDQNEDRQRIAMQEAGVEESRIYMDKQSGNDFERPGYRRVLRKLKPGEILLAVWIQSHDSFECETPFESPLNPLFSNRYKHRIAPGC